MLNKIILINLFFFLLAIFSNFTENIDLRSIFGVSSESIKFIKSPWTIFTYMFLHEKLVHFALNMFFLFVSSKIFLKYLNNKELLNNYIMGGLFGAIFFILPNINFDLDNISLIGSSASILSILTTSVIFTPNYSFKIFEESNFSIKIKYIAVIIIFYSIFIPIISKNYGGLLAHFGGIFYGLIFVFLHKKNISKKSNANELKRKYEDDYDYNTRKKIEEIKLNKILEKISSSGYKSLTKKEKDTLKKISNS
tara:strand:- start:1149 stop:1904 length:756 start_codon:yes stop_codon:yes gene_type:complete